MGSEWKEFTIQELADPVDHALATGPFGSAISSKYFQNSGVPVIRGSNLSQNVKDRLLDKDVVFVSNEKAKSFKRSIARKGDLVFTCWGTINQIGLIDERARFSEYVISNKQMKLTPNFDLVDPEFLYYLFQSPEKQDEILSNSIGSSVPGFNLGQLKSHKVKLPPLPEQKAITHILGSLDDKIELNRRMNATLEGLAQALFQSWFVDFDPVLDNALAAGNPIPDELTDRAAVRRQALDNGTANREAAQHFPASFQFTEELGWIPEGWEIRPLDLLINLIGGGTPKTSIDDYWNGDIPWFSVVDAPADSDVFVIDTEKKVTELGVKNSSTKILRKGTTIISARGTVGKCALVGTEMAMNQSCYGIQGTSGISDIYVYYTIREFVADLQQRSHGSVFSTITRNTFNSISVPFGGDKLAHYYDETVRSYLDRVHSNLFQNVSLTKLRNTILPQLISGELRIPNAAKLAKEALA